MPDDIRLRIQRKLGQQGTSVRDRIQQKLSAQAPPDETDAGQISFQDTDIGMHNEDPRFGFQAEDLRSDERAVKAQHFPNVQSLPSVVSTEQAQGEWLRRGVDITPSSDLKALASHRAIADFARFGLQPEAYPDLFRDLQGKTLYALSGLYSNPSPDEAPQLAQIATTRLWEGLESQVLARLNEETAKDKPDPTLVNQLQQDFAKIRSNKSRANEPRKQYQVMQAIQGASKDYRSRNDNDSVDSSSAAVFKGIMDIAVSDLHENGHFGPRHKTWDVDVLQAEVLMDRYIEDPRNAFVQQDFMHNLLRGAVTEMRMSRFGIQDDHKETITPFGLVAAADPGIVQQMIAAQQLEAAAKSERELGKRPDRPALRAEIEATIEAAGPDYIKPYIDVADNGYRQARQTLNLSGSNSPIADFSTRTWQRIGNVFNNALQVADEAISENPALLTGGLPAEMLVDGLSKAAAQKVGQGLYVDGEKEAQIISPDAPLGMTEGWQGDPDVLKQQTAAELDSEQAVRMLNPKGSIFRNLTLALWGDHSADVLTRYENLGIDVSGTRARAASERNQAADAALDKAWLGGFTEEESKQFDTDYLRAWKNWQDGKGSIFEVGLNGFRSLTGKVGKEWRSQLTHMVAEPGEAANVTLLTTAVGVPGGALGKRVLSGAGEKMSRAAYMERGKVAVAEALRTRPGAVNELKQFYETTLKNGTAEGLDSHLTRMVDSLDALQKESKLKPTEVVEPYNAKRAANVDEKYAQVRDLVRSMDPRLLDETISALNFDDLVQDWLRRPGVIRDVSAIAGADLNVGVSGGKKAIRMDSAAKGRELLGRLRDNPDLDVGDLAVSLENIMTPQAASFWERAFGRPNYNNAGTVNLVERFAGSFQSDTLAVRGLNASNRSNLDSLLEGQRVKAANEVRAAKAASVVDPDGSDILRSAAIGRARQATDLKRSSQTAWHRGLDVSQHPLMRAVDLEDVLYNYVSRHGGSTLYRSMRRSFETPEQFRSRLRRMTGRATEVDRNKRGNLDRETEAFKRELLTRHYSAPGIGKKTHIDTVEGVVSGKRARQLRNERLAIIDAPERRNNIREVLNELAEETPTPAIRKEIRSLEGQLAEVDRRLRFFEQNRGMFPREAFEEAMGVRTRTDLKDMWDTVERFADTEKKALFQRSKASPQSMLGDLWTLTQGLHDGRIDSAVRSAKDMGYAMRLNINAWHEKFKGLEAAAARLTPDERRLLNAAQTIYQDTGVSKPLRLLRDDPRFKDYFDGISPKTKDDAVRKVLTESDDFMNALLTEARDVGLITPQQYSQFVGRPYAPRLFSAFERRKHFRRDQESGAADVPAGENLALNLGEFRTQRHRTKYRVEVRQGDGALSQTFRTLDEAKAFVEERFGTRGKLQTEKGLQNKTFTGRTATGEDYKILEPLGHDLEELLGGASVSGGIDPTTSLFTRMRTMIQDFAELRYINSFDRKGIAFTEAEFDALRKQRVGVNVDKHFTRLEDTRKNGALAGKFVHNNVLRQVDEFAEGRVLRNAVHDAVEEATGALDAVIRFGRKSWDHTLDISARMKDAIVTNKILMNPKVMLVNLIGDNIFFGRAAAGRGWLSSGAAYRARADAMRIAWDLRRGNRRIEDLPADIQDAINDGVFDDNLFGQMGAGHSEVDNYLRVVYGSPEKGFRAFRDTLIAPEKDARLKPLIERSRQIESRLTEDLDPKVASLLREELNTIQKQTLDNAGPLAKAWAKSANAANMAILGRRRSLGIADARNRLTEMYGLMNNANRLAVFMYQRSKGVPTKVAMHNINEMMQTYSKVPTALKKLSRHPLGNPVVSFPYELVRTSMNMMRRNPGFIAGYMAAGAGANAMSMAAGGVDPIAVQRQMRIESPLGALSKMTSGLVLPSHDGSFTYAGMSGLEMVDALAGGNPGLFSAITAQWGQSADQGPVSSLFSSLVKGTGTWVANGPVTNFALGLFTQRDPLTGEVLKDTGHFGGKYTQRLVESVTPPWAPFIGSNHNQIMDSIGKSSFYSGRQRSVFSQVLQQWTGLRVVGKDTPEGLEGISGRVGQFGAAISGVGPSQLPWGVDGEGLAGTAEIGTQDKLAVLMIATAPFDLGARSPDRVYDKEFDKLRRAERLAQDSNPKARAQAEALRREALEGMERRFAAERKMNDPRFVREATMNEKINAVRRATESMDIAQAYDNASQYRKAAIVSMALQDLSMDRKAIRDLARRFQFNDSGLRHPTNPAEIDLIVGMLDTTLGTTVQQEDREILQSIRSAALLQKQFATVSEIKKTIRDEKYRAAKEELSR